jgi:hypothetical protein
LRRLGLLLGATTEGERDQDDSKDTNYHPARYHPARRPTSGFHISKVPDSKVS